VLAQGATAETRATARAAFSSRAEYQLSLSVKDETGLEQVLPPRRVRVDSHPSAPVPTVDKPDLGPTDLLSWQASTDPDPGDRLSYRVTLRTAGGKTVVNTSVTATQTALGRLPGNEALPEDQEALWTVTAVDPHGLEAVSTEGRFWYSRANAAPSAPAFAPELAAAGPLRSDHPRIAFTPGKDPDHGDPPSSLWHELQVSATSAFQNPLTQRIEAGKSELEALPLGDNARWFLRLRCLDRQGAASPWSAPLQLLVNTRDEPPGAPALREPAPGQKLYDLAGLSLAWSAATDPDPEARVHYRVVLQDAAGKEVARETGETRLRLEAPLRNEAEYRLLLAAVDETGLETAAPPLKVTVDSRPGSVAISGRGGQVLGAADVVGWSAATDPDPADRPSYQLEWAASRAFSEPHALTVTGLKQTLGQLKDLPENGEVWLRVRAVDPHQLEGPWSEVWALTYDAVKEAPTAPVPLEPADGQETAPGSVRFRWRPGQDPDPGPAPRHWLVLAGPQGERRLEATESIALELGSGSWSWRVEAADAGGLKSASPTWRLRVQSPPPPTEPAPAAP
jgi:hypothetical protein